MEVGDFTATVACFMRLTWAAAAGRLDLVGSPQPIRETHSALLPQGVRTRVSSTGDTGTKMAAFFIYFICLQCLKSPVFYFRQRLNNIIKLLKTRLFLYIYL